MAPHERPHGAYTSWRELISISRGQLRRLQKKQSNVRIRSSGARGSFGCHRGHKTPRGLVYSSIILLFTRSTHWPGIRGAHTCGVHCRQSDVALASSGANSPRKKKLSSVLLCARDRPLKKTNHTPPALPQGWVITTIPGWLHMGR